MMQQAVSDWPVELQSRTLPQGQLFPYPGTSLHTSVPCVISTYVSSPRRYRAWRGVSLLFGDYAEFQSTVLHATDNTQRKSVKKIHSLYWNALWTYFRLLLQ